MQTLQPQKSIALIKMILSMAIFGSIGYFTQISGLPSIELVFVRCICATVLLAIVWGISGQAKKELWNGREVLLTLLCGFFLVFNWVFLFKAFEETTVTVAISVYHLAPVFVLLIGALIYRERLTVKVMLAIILCFSGTVFISNVDFSKPFTELFPVGVLWALAAALFYAFLTLIGKGLKSLSAYATTFLQTGLGVVMLLPMVDFSEFQGLTLGNWLAIIMTGVIHTGIVYVLYFDSIRYLSTSIISVLVFLDPAIAILLDVMLMDVRPNVMQGLGIVLIFFGMALTFIKFKRRAV